MKPILGAWSVCLVVIAEASAQTSAIPAQFAVCVTTLDAKGRARIDSFWSTEDAARTRRSEILRDGWLTEGDETDREDAYPPHSIVKATVDPTLVNQPSCLPPAAQE
jgi:hypothetical protein